LEGKGSGSDRSSYLALVRSSLWLRLSPFLHVIKPFASTYMKVNFTNKSDIRLGFEIECVVVGTYTRDGFGNHKKTNKFLQFKKEIQALKRDVQIGYDGSIRCSDYETPVELRTPPLAPKDAMTLLADVFAIVNKLGYTNNSCGFHVNISSAHKTKMRNFNPIPFLSSKLWDEILSKFNRGNNEFCRSVNTKSKKLTKIRIINDLMERSKQKYRCVNLRHFGNGTAKSSRVEVRGFGNRDYSKKFETISEFVKRIERLFKLSCGAFSEMRTPRI
jgi:hypothetical protein